MTYKSVLTLPTFSSYAKITLISLIFLPYRIVKLISVLKNKIRIYSVRKKFIAFQLSTRQRVNNRRIEKRKQSKEPGKRCTGVSTVSETVYSKHFAFVATLDLSTFKQPQAYEPAASST